MSLKMGRQRISSETIKRTILIRIKRRALHAWTGPEAWPLAVPARMYSGVVPYRVGVICKSCGSGIEVDDEYIQGIRATEMAAALYKPAGRTFSDFVNVAWHETLTCENPDCGQTREYRGGDLLVYGS